MNEGKRTLNVSELCRRSKMSRQNYYKMRKQRASEEVDLEIITELVHDLRAVEPRIGSKRLYIRLEQKFKELDLKMGRDRFHAALKTLNLLVPKLPKAPRTTNSRHNLPIFLNGIKDLEITKKNQVWVSDLTYLRLDGAEPSFSYLALIMDRYSRKIIGYHCGPSLGAETCIKALEMALAAEKGARPIHHSDRGSQYCSHAYVNILKAYLLGISMTEVNHCYENAHAERVIGALKQEFGLGATFKSQGQLDKAVAQAITIYNNVRLHTSLGYQTPASVHNQAS